MRVAQQYRAENISSYTRIGILKVRITTVSKFYKKTAYMYSNMAN
jgi:hypothetical protein